MTQHLGSSDGDAARVRVVHPAALLGELEAKMRAPIGPRRAIRAIRRRSALSGSLLITGILTLGLVVPGILASHGSSFIDLTTAGASVDHNGATWVQGGIGAGTGQFDPFLTLSTNQDSEKGYNTTSANGEFDSFFGGGRTHPIQAAAIPPVDVGGTLYREFSLDANDQGGDDFMTIDEFEVYLDDQSDLTGYDAPGFSSDVAPLASLIYDLDAGGDVTALMRSQTLTPGSGVSDITVLVPDSLFPAECFYGSTTCNKWVYVFTQSGAYIDDGSDPVGGTQNWNVTAGFEEWRTRLVPVVNVTKTATTSFTQPYSWSVDKTVKVDGTCVDPATVDLFTGDSQDAEWCITATRTAGTASNPVVSGSVTVTNPTGGTVISDKIDATVESLEDVIAQGATDTNVTLTCPVTFPVTLKGGESFTCTYSQAVGSTTNGTNTATAVVTGADVPYSGSAAVDFTAATVNEVDETATLTDTEGPLNQAAVSGALVTYTNTYACDADDGTITNTATVTANDTSTQASDSASLTINCYEITVTKDADESFDRTYLWTIDKTSTTTALTLNPGESVVVSYDVTVDVTGSTDSNWAVDGGIAVHNPAPIDATINGVADLVSPAIVATVECGVTFPYTLVAGGTLNCTYDASVPDASSRTNTATATRQNYDYDADGIATASGTTDVDGSAAVDFTGATVNEIDECIDVTDTHAGALGTVCQDAAPQTFSYNRTIGPFDASVCGTPIPIDNTAAFTTNDTGTTGDDDHQIIVTVNCLDEGCTPGFWKTHVDAWVGYSSGQTVESVFDVPDAFGLDDDTLLTALGYPGGSGNVGAAQTLLRAAVAAVLNAAHPSISYPLSEAQIISMVNTALAGNRPAMLSLASTLDGYNNLGCTF